MLLSRTRRSRSAAVAVLVLLGSALALGSPSAPAEAATCTPGGSLTLTQTSVMSGLAPGVPAAAITGSLRNNSEDSTWIEAVVVTVASANPGARSARRDLRGARLRPARPADAGRPLLGPGGTTGFAGAPIGFNTTSTNQDACQGATVLRYETA